MKEIIPTPQVDPLKPSLDKEKNISSQSPELGRLQFSHFSKILTAATANLERQDIQKLPLEGVIDGVDYTLTYLGGKHGFACRVQLREDGLDPFNCVIKNNLQDVNGFTNNTPEYQVIQKYVPTVYGTFGEWFAAEELKGIQGYKGEVFKEALIAHPQLLDLYAQNVYDLIVATSKDRLAFRDVNFVQGSNCIINPETGGVRLIEQTNVWHSVYHEKELVTEALFSILQHISPQIPHTADIAFEVTRRIIQNNKPGDLFIQKRQIQPDHPSWEMTNSLSSDPYPNEKEILQNPLQNIDKVLDYDPNLDSSEGCMVNPELITILQEGNKEEFLKFIGKERKFKTKITTPSNPRSTPIILKPNEGMGKMLPE